MEARPTAAPPRARLECDGRRRCDAEAADLDSLGRQPGDEGGLQHRRGEPAVTADDGERSREHLGRGTTEVERERGRQIGVCPATDTVGAELHERTPEQISAW